MKESGQGLPLTKSISATLPFSPLSRLSYVGCGGYTKQIMPSRPFFALVTHLNRRLGLKGGWRHLTASIHALVRADCPQLKGHGMGESYLSAAPVRRHSNRPATAGKQTWHLTGGPLSSPYTATTHRQPTPGTRDGCQPARCRWGATMGRRGSRALVSPHGHFLGPRQARLGPKNLACQRHAAVPGLLSWVDRRLSVMMDDVGCSSGRSAPGERGLPRSY